MTLLTLALKATLLLTVGLVLVALLRRASAASRHAVWTTVFAAVILLPAAGAVLPAWAVVSMPEWWFPWMTKSVASSTVSVTEGLVSGAQPFAQASAAAFWSPTAVLLLVWAIGAFGRLVWIGAGLFGTWKLERSATEITSTRVRHMAAEVAEWMGVRRTVRWLSVSTDFMPVTWGALRPRVLLPEAACSWSDERLDAVLTHELSHVVRLDAASHLLARLATAVWWWHPLIWVAVRDARLDRERACDDLVLTRGTRASGYASDLVMFVESLRAPAADSSATLAMARRSQLEGRVMAILEQGTNRRGVSQSAILAAMLVMVLVWPLAVVGLKADEALAPNPADAVRQDPTPGRIGGQTQAPKKIKDVKPVYPESAKAAGAQGIVIVEAVIGKDGSVGDTKVIRSVHPDLDQAALDAVGQWMFTPTMLKGEPVPVIMTLTVNFKLDADGNPAVEPPPDVPTSGTERSEPVTWSPGDPPLRIGGNVKEPLKIKDVRPVYPADAQQAGIQGIVIIEAQIDQDGRVADARVIRPVEGLSDAAIDAVMQWEFTPTLVKGVAVSVIMTVTVNFTLR